MVSKSKSMSDKQVVNTVAKWLCNRASYGKGFTTFLIDWDEAGKPVLPASLVAAVARETSKTGLDFQQQVLQEASASGMYRNKTVGSCTSTGIYLNGCLRALGIPTRIVLCIPFADASDPREMEMVKIGISQPSVRAHLLASLSPLQNSWSSHTFNEVYVDGHWHRLNYNRLGQGIYDKQLFGMITHVATFGDWSEAEAHRTIGMRQESDDKNDRFGFRNPYSCISLRDQIGVHAEIDFPEYAAPSPTIQAIHWSDDPELPERILNNFQERNRKGCVAVITSVGSLTEFTELLASNDRTVRLTAQKDDAPGFIKTQLDRGCFWIGDGVAKIYIPLSDAQRSSLSKDTDYLVQPVSEKWRVTDKSKMILHARAPF